MSTKPARADRQAATPVILLAAGLLAAPVSNGADLTEDLAAAVAGSTVNLGFRYRFEAVDDDAFAKEAWANTLRSRLTVAPKPVAGFGVLLEVDDVRHIGADNFNDTRNGVTDRPGVTDPEGTDLNQALLRYTGWQDTEVVVGRQRIERANQRFVGGVGWRQNEQTFDAAGISHKFGKKLATSYSWVGQVNRIQGPDSGTPPADLDSNTHLLDASYAFGPLATVAAYGYLMDFDNADNLSNDTYGVRLTGGTDVATGWKAGYSLEYAEQSDGGDNPVDYDASYYLVEGSISAARLGFKVGYEVLEGDDTAGGAFRTPLATLHAFQGWADKFLTTPDAGVEDLYFTVTGKALGADLLLRIHDFNAEASSADWGSELDFSANWPLGKHYAILLKGATYDADDLSTDTSKYWVQLTANF
jgi:hypothetical protein